MSKLRRWLASEEGNLLRMVLNANVIVKQHEATEALMDAAAEARVSDTLIERLNESLPFMRTIETLQQINKDDALLFRVRAEVTEE